MIKKILLGLVVLLIAFFGYVATRPDEYTLERSATINAPADVVFAQVNDFHNWAAWSPWEKLDPAMKKVYEGPPSGQGAMYSWESEKVGHGKMTLETARAPEFLDIKLQFLKPFESTNRATFTFKPAGETTHVTWGMKGQSNFMFKAMTVFRSADELMGKDFEAGLASMKTVSEAAAVEQAKAKAAAAAAPPPPGEAVAPPPGQPANADPSMDGSATPLPAHP
jgi:hypothetical protein